MSGDHSSTDGLVAMYEQKKPLIRARLAEFSSVRPEEYFFELAYCLLTPQSSALNAGKVVDRMRKAGYPAEEIDLTEFLRNKSSYIRFHNTKAQNLREAWNAFPQIMKQLQSGSTGEEMREWLVGNVRGLGWKEASHFLRNIGHRNLAILDRHILRNLRKYGVLRSLPRTLTKRIYLATERRFRRFASSIGIDMDELDLLFWSTETGAMLK